MIGSQLYQFTIQDPVKKKLRPEQNSNWAPPIKDSIYKSVIVMILTPRPDTPFAPLFARPYHHYN